MGEDPDRSAVAAALAMRDSDPADDLLSGTARDPFWLSHGRWSSPAATHLPAIS